MPKGDAVSAACIAQRRNDAVTQALIQREGQGRGQNKATNTQQGQFAFGHSKQKLKSQSQAQRECGHTRERKPNDREGSQHTNSNPMPAVLSGEECKPQTQQGEETADGGKFQPVKQKSPRHIAAGLPRDFLIDAVEVAFERGEGGEPFFRRPEAEMLEGRNQTRQQPQSHAAKEHALCPLGAGQKEGIGGHRERQKQQQAPNAGAFGDITQAPGAEAGPEDEGQKPTPGMGGFFELRPRWARPKYSEKTKPGAYMSQGFETQQTHPPEGQAQACQVLGAAVGLVEGAYRGEGCLSRCVYLWQ